MTIANVEMAKAWEDEADHWIEHADRYDASGDATWRRFLDAVLISPTDRVLDVGCGTGRSTRDVARLAPQGSVLGIDLAGRMLEVAREVARADGLANTEFRLGDAQVHPFDDACFDIAISRYGAMFFADRGAAFRNIARALRPGGRIAFLGWQALADNEWLTAMRDALAAGRDLPTPPNGGPGPFGLADPDGVRAALEDAGFEDIAIEGIHAPIWFGTDAADAWYFISKVGIVKGLTETLDEATRAQVLADLQDVIAAHETDAGVTFGSASWLITARRA